MPVGRCALAPPAAVTLRRQWDPSAKGESSPCSISLLNPLLWLVPSQQRKGTKLPGRLWQAAPLSAGQKLIPSSSPVPPTQGAGLARLAFCVSVRWREGQRTGKQRVAPAPMQLHRQTDGQMSSSSPVPYRTLATATSTSLSPRLCLMRGEGWKAPQPAVSPCGNGGDFNHSGSGVL